MKQSDVPLFDVVVVGGGPAGLSAALVLGRSRRHTLVCDSGEYRNAAAQNMHGFLSRDGIAPHELRSISREQLACYETVTIRQKQVLHICPDVSVASRRGDRECTRFQVTFEGGESVQCRKVLLATGVVDDVPEIPGIGPLYGKSVHHCPYCDGWEVRDKPLAVYGQGTEVMRFALEMTLWSKDLTVCTNGPSGLTPEERERLSRNGIALREDPILCLDGTPEGQLERIVFVTGEPLSCHALFFRTQPQQRSNLATSLNCVFTEKGTVDTRAYEATNIPGVYVAGDASPIVQLAIIAASEGAQAAFAINTDLIKEDLL